MNERILADRAPPPKEASSRLITEHAATLRAQLQAIATALYPPSSAKTLRRFQIGETAKIVGVSDTYLRKLALEGAGPQPSSSPSGRNRSYSLSDIHALRSFLDETKRAARRYKPWRQEGEGLQVISVMNFKGGSGKTTTAAHLAQSLVLRGYRVLAIDLDPQASLSSLFGVQPELDVNENETLYGAIRYDANRRPITDVIHETYFTGLDLIPANLELMEFEHETPRMLAGGRKRGDQLFFARLAHELTTIDDRYDVVVIDCPPQLGYLTLSALCAATSLLVTVHPQMLDVASMSQFLAMAGDLLSVVEKSGGSMRYDAIRYLITRYEPQDGPQTRIVALLRNLFGDAVLTTAMVKSSAVSDAGLSKQTLYEVGRESVSRSTYDRAMEALEGVNGEIDDMIQHAWGRS